jgi:hypothetical protein
LPNRGQIPRGCQNGEVSRTNTLRAVLLATVVAGASLPHMVTGELAGSWLALTVGVVAGGGCLGLALIARGRGGRALGAVGLAAAALTPLIAYLAQEGAERETGVESGHAEPSLLAAILSQAPLVFLALVAVSLLAAAVRTIVRAWARRGPPWLGRRSSSDATCALGAALPSGAALTSANGQRAPPLPGTRHRLAPSG